jgi:hypothetical protein
LQRYQVNLSQEPKIKLGVEGRNGKPEVDLHLNIENHSASDPACFRRLPRRLSWP